MKCKFDTDYFNTHLGVEAEQQPEIHDHFPIRLELPNPSEFPIMEEGKKGGVKFSPFGVIQYLHACYIVFDGPLSRIFDGRVYAELPKAKLEDMIYQAVYNVGMGYIPTPYEINTVIKAATSLLKHTNVAFPDPQMGADYEGSQIIVFENGVYNFDTGQLLPFTPYLYMTGYIHARYDPTIQTSSAHSVLSGIIPQDETLDFLFEMIGYLMFNPNLNPPAIFNLYGPGQTGKSAIANMISVLMQGSVSKLGLSQLTARFTVAELEGKAVNICGETGDTSSKDTHFDGELMKRLSDGDEIMVERKGQNPYYIHNTAKFLFVTNTIPDFGDNSSGLYRRLYVIPCRVKQDPKLQIYDMLIDDESRSWVVNKALKAYQLFRETKTFTSSPQMEIELNQYKSQDSVMDFLQQTFGATNIPVVAHSITEDDVLCYTTDLYNAYTTFCRESLSKPLSRKKFIEKIRNEYNLKTKVVSYTTLDRVTTKTKYVM